MRAAAQPVALADRETLRCALRVALVKDRRDENLFNDLFCRYFRLELVASGDPSHVHGHGHDDTGATEAFTMSEEPSTTPQQGHSHRKPADIRDFFGPEDLPAWYKLHQEADKIDLAALTDEIALSKDQRRGPPTDPRVQLETSRLRGAGAPGHLSAGPAPASTSWRRRRCGSGSSTTPWTRTRSPGSR